MNQTSLPERPGTKKREGRLSGYLKDPLGAVVSASIAVIGSFGVVLSGIWLINAGLD